MGRRLRTIITTPPRTLFPAEEDQPFQLETPQRSVIHSVVWFYQCKKIRCKLDDIDDVFDIPTSTSSNVIASKRCWRVQNSEITLDHRGNPRLLTTSDAIAIDSYIK